VDPLFVSDNRVTFEIGARVEFMSLGVGVIRGTVTDWDWSSTWTTIKADGDHCLAGRYANDEIRLLNTLELLAEL
jgi:hypothetical protein